MSLVRLRAWLACVLASLVLVACAQSSCDQPKPFTVMTYNVGDCCSSHPTRQKFKKALADLATAEGEKPDVMLLQEFRQAKSQADLQTLGEEMGYPHAVWSRSGLDTQARLAIFSRFPLGKAHVVKFTSSPLQRVALAVKMHVGAKNVQVVNVHFDHFKKDRTSSGDVRWASWSMLRQLGQEMLGTSVRSRMAKELNQWLERQGAEYVIVGGDLNTVPLSGASRALEDHLDDALWPSVEYFKGTYSRVRTWVQPRVDFLFHTPGLTAVDGRVLSGVLGDHHPVRSGFVVCAAP
ncbi:MAG: hypothetical protein F6K39_02135 [Okeania sp. SIO3B3]|nr:hypothetical protein [Okeania sp. SIO3B3]